MSETMRGKVSGKVSGLYTFMMRGYYDLLHQREPVYVTTDVLMDMLPIVSDRAWYITEYDRIMDGENREVLAALVHELSDGRIDEHLNDIALQRFGIMTSGIIEEASEGDRKLWPSRYQQIVQILGAKRLPRRSPSHLMSGKTSDSDNYGYYNHHYRLTIWE